MNTEQIKCPHCVGGWQYRQITNPLANVHGWTPVENDHTSTWYVRECAACCQTAKILKANASVPVVPLDRDPQII